MFYRLLCVSLLVGGCSESHDTTAKSAEAQSAATQTAESSAETAAGGRSAAMGGAAGNAALAAIAAARARPRVAETPTFESDKTTTTASKDQVKFEMDLRVPAGTELHRCIYAQFPSDRGVIAVPRVESHYTPGSHHLLAYRSELTAIPENRTGLLDCYESGATAAQRGSYYEAQEPEENRELPKGIAHLFQPGEVLILEAHYLNSTDHDLDAHVEMITHTMNADDVKQEAGTIFFNNVNIMVPPMGKSHSEMTCTLPQDIHLAQLWSHMHARGVKFVAETSDEDAAKKLGTLYEELDWAEPRPRADPSDPAAVLRAGSTIKFGCDFQNDTDKVFRFGQSADTGEMCILHGMYWPRMPRAAETCMGGKTTRN